MQCPACALSRDGFFAGTYALTGNATRFASGFFRFFPLDSGFEFVDVFAVQGDAPKHFLLESLDVEQVDSG